MIWTGQPADYYLDNYDLDGVFKIFSECLDYYYPGKGKKKNLSKEEEDKLNNEGINKMRNFFKGRGST